MSDLSPSTVEELLAIKGLLAQARRLAEPGSSYHIAAAVILLDAANERALNAVANDVGKDGGREKFDGLLSAVRSKLPGWAAEGASDVSRLHRVRNTVQHEGVTPSHDQFSRWFAESSTFIDSLVFTQFEVDLAELRLASAIRSDQLRRHFDTAESHYREGDYPAVVAALRVIVDLAMEDWGHDHRRSHNSSTFPSPSMRASIDEVKSLTAEVDGLRRAMLLSAFAGDAGESTWFANLATQSDTASADDARRALGFTFWWIAAWEASPARGAADRRTRWQKSQRLIRTNDTETAKIARLDLTNRYGRTVVDATLSAVPPHNEFDAWWSTLQKHLNLEAYNGGSPRWTVLPTGHVIADVDTGAAVDQAVSVLRRCLDHTATDLITTATARQKEQAATEQHRAAWREAEPGTFPAWVQDAYPLDFSGNSAVHLVLHPDVHHLANELSEEILADPRITGCWHRPVGQLSFQPLVSAATVAEICASSDNVVDRNRDQRETENAERTANRRDVVGRVAVHNAILQTGIREIKDADSP